MTDERGSNRFLVIPAIDLLGGRCVRLYRGDYSERTVYNDEPVTVARRWADAGAERLHLVDLDGAREGKPCNLELIRTIVAAVGIPCQVGGGVREEAVAAQLLEAGVAYVVVGSRAVSEPDWLARMADRFPGRIWLGLDTRNGRPAVRGWTATVDRSPRELLAEADRLPLAGVIVTAIERDGTLAGPALDLLSDIVHATRHPVLASGGVTTIDDVRRLAQMPLAGCIVGKALYENKLSLQEAILTVRQLGR